MEASVHRATLRFRQAGLLLAAPLLLCACTFRPAPVSAISYRAGDYEVVAVNISSADANTIKKRELYFTVVVTECQDGSERYPAESFIGGQRASDFDFSTSGEIIEIVGRVPARIFESYADPCVFLEGGGYLAGKIKSKVAAIQALRELEPN
jgi:hypothetical protein